MLPETSLFGGAPDAARSLFLIENVKPSAASFVRSSEHQEASFFVEQRSYPPTTSLLTSSKRGDRLEVTPFAADASRQSGQVGSFDRPFAIEGPNPMGNSFETGGPNYAGVEIGFDASRNAAQPASALAQGGYAVPFLGSLTIGVEITPFDHGNDKDGPFHKPFAAEAAGPIGNSVAADAPTTGIKSSAFIATQSAPSFAAHASYAESDRSTPFPTPSTGVELTSFVGRDEQAASFDQPIIGEVLRPMGHAHKAALLSPPQRVLPQPSYHPTFAQGTKPEVTGARSAQVQALSFDRRSKSTDVAPGSFADEVSTSRLSSACSHASTFVSLQPLGGGKLFGTGSDDQTLAKKHVTKIYRIVRSRRKPRFRKKVIRTIVGVK